MERDQVERVKIEACYDLLCQRPSKYPGTQHQCTVFYQEPCTIRLDSGGVFGLNVWVGSQIGTGREDHFQGSGKKVNCCWTLFSRSLLQTGSKEIGQ